MRSGTIGSIAALVATVAFGFGGVQAASAQRPSPANPPATPAPPANADLHASLHGEGNTEQNSSYAFEAHIVNHGPGTAEGVTVIVDTPGEFDLDESNHPDGCVTHPFTQGRMTCFLGSLPAGGEIRLKFRGEYREDGEANTHVIVSGTTPDPEPTNDSETQRVRVYDPDHGKDDAAPPVVTPDAPPPPPEEEPTTF